MNTFSINNYTLKRYLIKLLNYNNVDSESYKSVRSKLKGIDDFVMSLIGGTNDYHNLKGIDKSNYINELLADIRYRGEDTIKHISFAARNLHYEIKIQDNMNKRELFTELRKVCANSKNPESRRLFNELVKSFTDGCPCGASVSNAGVGDGSVDLKGEPITQDEIDKLSHEASKVDTFADKISSFDDFSKWIHNFMKNAHGDSYNEELTTKVANDLHNKYGEDYGAMIGAAKSFLFE